MNGVIWARAHNRCRCSECSKRIRIGDRMATWAEICFVGYLGTRLLIRRRYCVPCGGLLEDSLTTTETIR